ncbi:hypothetical protein SPRG_01102 [Saprolegnia parasitica CBS 223.65]|uniref:Las1-like protein n=1 Tax=Saprolegnia parasitica (strain CBS 223.65) TaxID=695850 RepID=A0A067CWZ5_SAPPC|nr:hypothetical protein SPRG_01102 [Saprolegnia parasitica CBS 223.65]KDO35038.1 hypothetical protein SPRG_01102 [Saprolegnia parasitica CBS 223.65]|eukprot:XP_012194691.1 hypothetical protein SPRG_01102 [Saprolegnia parasitica CBS 223.65]
MEVDTEVPAVAPQGSPVIRDKDYLYAGRRAFAVWMDWHEWQQVYRALFAAELHRDATNDDKLRGLARIATWRARSDVPVAIEVTAQLAEIGCHDGAYGLATPGRSMYRSYEELRLLYAATILRCVNGLVDASQKGAYAMPVSTLAMRIGIPLWVVDIRHESAHTKLPALPTLQLAAQTLWKWLFEHYWQPQEASILERVARIEGLLRRCLETNEPLGPLMVQDLDALAKIVVPLLVSGPPYTSSAAAADPTTPKAVGLLLAPSTNEASAIALCCELQAIWPLLDAAMVVALASHVTADPSMVASASKWIFFFAQGDAWARSDTFFDGLAEAHAILRQSDHPDVRPLCGTLATYIDLPTTHARLNKPEASAAAWTRCAAWTPTPLGLHTPFGAVCKDWTFRDAVDDLNAGHMVLLSELPAEAPDALDPLAAYEASFFDKLTQAVDLDLAIANEIEQVGQNSHNESVPDDEVSRLHDAIEIW